MHRGGGRGGRGGGGGGGGQRWWDPVWRNQKLAEIKEQRKDERELDVDDLLEKLEQLKRSQDEELILRQKLSRDALAQFFQTCSLHGFFSKKYGPNRDPYLVVSKVELPAYRAELDCRSQTQEQDIDMSDHEQQLVARLLKKLKDFDSEHPFDPKKTLNPSIPPSNDKIFMKTRSGDAESAALAGVLDASKQRRGYTEMAKVRASLPTAKHCNEFLQLLERNQVLVISGETGSGKTTQIPQYILDDAICKGQGGTCNIVCTQPRRISAISVAERVAEERCDELGNTVGYQIRLEAKRSAGTHLLYCTTGILLRKLMGDPLLEDVSHVIVDEIHERGMDEDFLLIVLKDLLPKRPNLRVILMSATLNAHEFSAYFNGCPTLHIQGFTFPVKEMYLEDVVELTGCCLSTTAARTPRAKFGGERFGRRRKQPDGSVPMTPASSTEVDYDSYYARYPDIIRVSMKNWKLNNESEYVVDLQVIVALIRFIVNNKPPGAILVFLTGWDDISKLHNMLKDDSLLGNPAVTLVIPLHGSMPTVNQRQIFDSPPRGIRKIVLATNIAETSITINDVVYVVDGGLCKQNHYDAVNDMPTLIRTQISKAAAAQRKGRAGRVQSGECFHLYPEAETHSMISYELPEILRTPLAALVLQIQSLGFGPAGEFLAKAMNPPQQRSVVNAINLLKTIGALEEERETLTPLGSHLAKIPVHPRIGKMLLFGAMFDCVDAIAVIAAAMAFRDPFVIPLDKKALVDSIRRRICGDSCSDHVAVLRAYQGWKNAANRGEEHSYVNRNFLSLQTLRMMSEMVQQLKDLVVGLGFGQNQSSGYSETSEAAEDNLELIKALICAGMYPNIASLVNGKKKAKVRTREDGKVKLHPSSCNCVPKEFPHPWLVYNEKVKTTDIFLRDSTNVSDFAVLLFGGSLHVEDNNTKISMASGFCSFSGSKDVVQLVLSLRSHLDMLLQQHVESSGMVWREVGRGVIETVKLLLEGTASSGCNISLLHNQQQHQYHQQEYLHHQQQQHQYQQQQYYPAAAAAMNDGYQSYQQQQYQLYRPPHYQHHHRGRGRGGSRSFRETNYNDNNNNNNNNFSRR